MIQPFWKFLEESGRELHFKLETTVIRIPLEVAMELDSIGHKLIAASGFIRRLEDKGVKN